MKNARGWFAACGTALGAAVTLAGMALVGSAQAQQQPPPPGGFGGGGGGFPGGGGFGGQRPGGFQPGMMMGPVQMTATDKHVYVLRGNTLYQFDTTNLKLLNQAELPRPEPPRDRRDGSGPGGPPPP